MKKNKIDTYFSVNGHLIKKNKVEQLFGVPPDQLAIHDYFTVHKSAKKGQNSFRITKDLLESLMSTSLKIQKQPKLIITIPNDSEEFIINCSITKSKRT